MKSIKISLAMAQKVKEFVNVTQEYPCEILLKSGKYVVDAKSILGIFSLDLSQPITVEVYDDNCEELLAKLPEKTDERIFVVYAALKKGVSVDEVFDIVLEGGACYKIPTAEKPKRARKAKVVPPVVDTPRSDSVRC